MITKYITVKPGKDHHIHIYHYASQKKLDANIVDLEFVVDTKTNTVLKTITY